MRVVEPAEKGYLSPYLFGRHVRVLEPDALEGCLLLVAPMLDQAHLAEGADTQLAHLLILIPRRARLSLQEEHAAVDLPSEVLSLPTLEERLEQDKPPVE